MTSCSAGAGAAPHDTHHLHLPLQADSQEERLAAGAERPFPPAHRRQSDDRGRHGWATVAGILGHSQPSTTLDIYTHAFDKNKKAASAKLQEGLDI